MYVVQMCNARGHVKSDAHLVPQSSADELSKAIIAMLAKHGQVDASHEARNGLSKTIVAVTHRFCVHDPTVNINYIVISSC